MRATTVLLPAIFSECNLRSNLLDHKRNFIIHEDMHGQQPTDLLNRLLTVVNQNLRSRGIPESRVEKIKSLLSQSVAKEYSPAQQQAYRELALIQMREAFGNRKDDLSACQQELYANSWLRFLIWDQPIEAKQSTKAETEQNKVYQPVVSSIVESIKTAIADYFFDQHTDAYGRQRSDVLLGQLNKIVASKASPSDQLKQIALLLTNMTKGRSTMNESTLHSLSGRSTQLLKRLLLTLGIRIPVDRLIKMPESKLFKTFLHSAPQQALFEKFPLNNLLLAKTETEQKIAEWLTTTSQEFKDLIQSQTSQSDEDWLLEQGVRYACLGNGLSAAIKIAAQHQKTNPQQASTADTKERKVAHDAPVEPRLKIITNIHQQALQRLYALLPQQHQLKSLHPNIQEMTTAINEFVADHKGSRSASKPAFFSQDPSELAYKKISEKLNGYYVSVNETQNRHIRASFGDPSFLLKEFNKIFIPPVQGQQSLFLRSF